MDYVQLAYGLYKVMNDLSISHYTIFQFRLAK
jgi:hypothetical protein